MFLIIQIFLKYIHCFSLNIYCLIIISEMRMYKRQLTKRISIIFRFFSITSFHYLDESSGIL